MINENEAIRVMILAVSKGLSHVRDALRKVQQSCEKYGTPPTRLFYTDSAPIEEKFIVSIFPVIRENSLSNLPLSMAPSISFPGSSAALASSALPALPFSAARPSAASSSSFPSAVAPFGAPLPASSSSVLSVADLPSLALPPEWKRNILCTDKVDEINGRASLVLADAEAIHDDHIVIGLDAEWPVDLINGKCITHKTAVIQWAYKNHITIAQVLLS